MLRGLSSITPGEWLVEVRDLVVGDLCEDTCEPSLRIDVVELCRFDEGEGDGYGFAAAL